ncbi:hypothetical protein [Nocardia altamirensis]|uniref:hypothetical protein n=1 Tax=Nocardia altamirensis TaxID=472158 RepID=UPI0008404792|nr:hypothetical protein [Nocardia altamirensis]
MTVRDERHLDRSIEQSDSESRSTVSRHRLHAWREFSATVLDITSHFPIYRTRHGQRVIVHPTRILSRGTGLATVVHQAGSISTSRTTVAGSAALAQPQCRPFQESTAEKLRVVA